MTTTEHEDDVIDLLTAQHREMRRLLVAVKNDRGEPRRQAFQQLVRLVATHESAEEQVVHPVARRVFGAAALDDLLREEDDVKTQMSDLYKLGVDHRLFDRNLAPFETAVLAHTAHEEEAEFSALRRHRDPTTLRRMARAVRIAEAVAPKRPHPQAGVHPVTNFVTALPVALFDEGREAFARWRRSRRN